MTAATAIIPACSRPGTSELTREAFLVFDNLTGDASLQWIAEAAPRMLAYDLGGVPKIVPIVAPNIRDAYLAGASRLVHGYYQFRSGKLRFELDVEDVGSHRMIQTAAEDGAAASIKDALDRAARGFNPSAHAFPAPDAAIEAWGQGNYEHAVSLDPSFTLAWISWIQQATAAGDAAHAQQLADQALMQPNLDSPIERAQLELTSATLRKDQTAQLAASRKLADLVPYDPAIWTSLADADMRARRFTDATRDYETLGQTDPTDGNALNLLGYARGLAGDLDGAKKAFDAYGQEPGQAENSVDSWGEILFINGKFDQAELQFEKAYSQEPGFIQGETLWKAAHARWLSGDLPAADKVVERYWQDRASAKDPLLDWRRANWLYETGRQDQARDLLMQIPPENAQAATIAKGQLAIWAGSHASDLAKLEQAYRESDPVNDGLPRVFYAEALLKAGKKDEVRELLKRWPLPAQNDALLQSLLYPLYLELRKEAELV